MNKVQTCLAKVGKKSELPRLQELQPRWQHEQTPVQLVASQFAYHRTQLIPKGPTPAALLALQRTVGNWQVQRMVAQHTTSTNGLQPNAREEANLGIKVQTKLTLGAPNDSYEQEADRVADKVMRISEPRSEEDHGTPPTKSFACQAISVVQRQEDEEGTQRAKEENENDESPAKDTMADTLVSEIIVSLARKRVGFRSAVGMILGDIDTDLKPGKYELKPDTDHQKWIIVEPAVKTGLRFTVDLEGANPWTLRYPESLPLTVTAGSLVEPKVYGDMFDAEGKIIDPLWLYEDMPPEMKPKPIAGIDDFESTRYDLDYRSEKGNLSKWLVVSYRDNTVKDINLDTITQTTPRLWAAKQEALKIMDDYNTLFILGTFPTIFFIITISPTVSVPKGANSRYTPNRRSFPKLRGGSTPAKPLIEPVNGEVNVGGGLEKGSEGATNLNPIKAGSGGPSKGIPNHIKAGFEDIGNIFKPGSVKKIFSNRLRYGDVNWSSAANGSAKVMAKGGKLSLNVWTSNAKEAQVIVDAFVSAGLKDVRAIGEGTGTIIVGTF